jgi:hypothetical protein
MNNLINTLNELKQLNYNIYIVKVPAHSDLENNDKVDILAKEAAQIAKDNYLDENLWNDDNTPAIVDMQVWISEINDKYKQQQEQQFNDLYDSIYFDNNTEYITDNIFLNAMYYNNNKFRNNINNILKEEIFNLNYYENEIITKLRCEHINLNNYINYYFKNCSNYCNNQKCHQKETVTHYIMDCLEYETLRNEMRTELCKIDPLFNNEEFFTIDNILFPHIWINQPTKEEANYKLIWKNNKWKRLKILRTVVKFVIKSKRFDTENGI